MANILGAFIDDRKTGFTADSVYATDAREGVIIEDQEIHLRFLVPVIIMKQWRYQAF